MKTIEELKRLVDFVAENHPGCEVRFCYPFRTNQQTWGSVYSYQIYATNFSSTPDQLRFYIGRARPGGKEVNDVD